jgi:hypothetical protein
LMPSLVYIFEEPQWRVVPLIVISDADQAIQSCPVICLPWLFPLFERVRWCRFLWEQAFGLIACEVP